jgi:alanyl-tRNA synthetase
MKSQEIREKYLKFFEKQGHKIIDSSLLVPENDPTTLFTGSGMQPMVPYLLGATHPQGNRIVDSQKCFRSGDIEDVGDNRHTTFFEMLGNWSLGSYFKEEQIKWMFEFLTKEIGLDPNKLFVSVFIGDPKNGVEKDIEAGKIWKELFKTVGIDAKEVDIGSEENGYKIGMQNGRIFYYDAKKNWWSRAGVPENMPIGEPGGPDSEMFYQIDEIEHDKKFGEHCHINCDCGRYIEIGNNVFMQFVKTENGFKPLPQKNIDFGGGLERLVLVSEGKSDIFKTDFFEVPLRELEKISGKSYDDDQYKRYFRVILDHLRASIFLIGDGVEPGNTDRNYFVRRLLRRAILYFDKLLVENYKLSNLVESFLEVYKSAYPETYSKIDEIKKVIDIEEEKFRKTLKEGLKQFNWFLKNVKTGENELPASIAFDLVTTYGFPFELIEEICKEKGMTIDKQLFNNRIEAHKIQSRKGSEQKFKGGLGDTSEESVKYHTATHLLHKALRDVLGDSVSQKGSNITPERLRFDFSFERKMTDEEKNKVEEVVNQKIQESLPVKNIIMNKDEAEKSGALHFFGDKYGDQVSVYFIGENLENAYSKEFCGGPHITNTKVLGKFKIVKEEAVSAGVRRIKAILE